MNKVAAIIQARMGSVRLPGKVLFKLGEDSVLSHLINRLKSVEKLDLIVVATTTLELDDLIADEVMKTPNILLFRGSSDDVLKRYVEASEFYGVDVIVRITADCPFIDPSIISKGLRIFLSRNYDLVTNAGPDLVKRTFPRGLDFEIFRSSELVNINKLKLNNYDREHVTPFFYRNNYNIKHMILERDLSHIRLTLDTEDDYLLLNEVHKRLYVLDKQFDLSEIENLFFKKPELLKINQHVIQKV
jgi:spore coat polysaccharide biosynthesis protein SpsF